MKHLSSIILMFLISIQYSNAQRIKIDSTIIKQERAAASFKANISDHIAGKVILNPELSELHATLEFNFNNTEKKDTLRFFLHNQLKVHKLTGNNIRSYELTKATNMFGMDEIPFTNFLEIVPKDPNSHLVFKLEYSGRITEGQIIFGPDAFSSDWVELSLGSAWFPFYTDMNKKYTHSLEIEIPKAYSVTGIGKAKKINANTWLITSNRPNLDLIIVASKDLVFEKKESDYGLTELFYTTDRDKNRIDFILEKAGAIQSFYNNTFAKDNKIYYQKIVFPPDRNRAKAEGYSRNPFIMLNHDNSVDHLNIFMFIAHEIAHFWWNKGNSQTKDNFINESLAEYSYLLVLRELYGIEAYNKVIQTKKKKLLEKKLPSITKLSQFPNLNYPLVYVKGPLLLSDLETKIGYKNMIKLLQKSINCTSLDEFLNVLKAQEGEEIYNWFYNEL